MQRSAQCSTEKGSYEILLMLIRKFDEFFMNILNPHGFCIMNGTHIFAKLVDETILQYFTFRSVPSLQKGKKAFSMMAGIDTIYAETLSKAHLLAFALDYKEFRLIDHTLNCKGAYWNIYHYDINSITEALQDAGNETINNILLHISSVNSLEKYIDFCKYMSPARLYYADHLKIDSPLLIKTNNHESFHDLFDFTVSLLIRASLSNGGNGYISLEEKRHVLECIKNSIIIPRDRVYSDPELLEAVYSELSHRQLANKSMLMRYKIIQ